MRKQRIIGEGDTAYHCRSRAINHEHLFDEEARQKWCELLYLYADFCGMTVLTHSELSNHNHSDIFSPDRLRAEAEITDEEIVRRYKLLYTKPTQSYPIAPGDLLEHLKNHTEAGEEIRARLLARMHHISIFMKELKAAFTKWFNKRHNRHGTVWCDRFKSSIVEKKSSSLLLVAHYVDLNPMRAGMIRDLRQYPYCGYTMAMRGDPRAIKGILLLMNLCGYTGNDPLGRYRALLANESLRDCEGKAHLTAAEAKIFFEIEGDVREPESYGDDRSFFGDGLACGSPPFVRHELDRNADKLDYKEGRKPYPLPECFGELAVLALPRRTRRTDPSHTKTDN